ncbi:MAG: hypothetical protein GX989_06235 [Firmicutes bacterium]|nr:hypothetical protein [Bacillota bacterium]
MSLAAITPLKTTQAIQVKAPTPVLLQTDNSTKKPATIGVYYFDGWSGKNRFADDPNEPWAKNAPTHLTRRFVEEFSDREPVWGWRNDELEIMERQIDLAADNGVDFFLFCWYWKDNKGPINVKAIENDHHHKSMELFMKAKNRHRIKYSLLIANHGGFEILGKENWKDATRYWSKYFKDPQYMTVDGKPLLVLFGTGDNAIDNESLEAMQVVAKEEGLKNGLSIAGCGEPARSKSGFTHSTHYNVTSGYADGSEEHSFQELIDRAKPRWKGTEEQPYIPVINSGWDKRPWEGSNGLSNQPAGWYFPDSSPELFKNFLMDAIQWMDDNPTKTPKERIVLIYAWNELGEGGYLVPTKGDPDAAKLKAIKEVVGRK